MTFPSEYVYTGAGVLVVATAAGVEAGAAVVATGSGVATGVAATGVATGVAGACGLVLVQPAKTAVAMSSMVTILMRTICFGFKRDIIWTPVC
jgi:tetrahydromethanopterin S-methyltransferase subunit D